MASHQVKSRCHPASGLPCAKADLINFASFISGTPPSKETPAGNYPFIVTSDDGRKVPVVQAYAFGKYLGYLKVEFDNKGNVVSSHGNPILLNSSIPEGEIWGESTKRQVMWLDLQSPSSSCFVSGNACNTCEELSFSMVFTLFIHKEISNSQRPNPHLLFRVCSVYHCSLCFSKALSGKAKVTASSCLERSRRAKKAVQIGQNSSLTRGSDSVVWASASSSFMRQGNTSCCCCCFEKSFSIYSPGWGYSVQQHVWL